MGFLRVGVAGLCAAAIGVAGGMPAAQALPPGGPARTPASAVAAGVAEPPSDLPRTPSVAAAPAEIVADVGRGQDVQIVTVEQGPGGLTVGSTAADGRAEARRDVVDAQSDPDVLAVDVDTRVHELGFTDPRASEQWGMSMLDVSNAWATTTGAGVVVAVVDSGVEGEHPDLAGAVLPGTNTRANRGDLSSPTKDTNGHGTHVAGVIAARAGNGAGGVGVAPGASILPVKVLDKYGGGWVSDVTEGIIWAVDNGAAVINLSLGGDDSDLIRSAVDYALAAGVVVVAASGNEATDQPSYPAAIDGVLSVAALQEDGSPAGYSNFGPTVDLQAPGDQILSTVPGGYERMSGTSMASPFVAGAAALVRAARPDVDAARTLISTARSNPAARDGFGAGVVDPVAAVAGAGACAGGCATLEVPAAPAADEAPVLLMKQSVSAPRRVRTGKQKALPSLSDHSVQVRRWRSKNPAKCATRRSQLYGGWKVVGKRPGVCRIKVVVPKADGIEPLKVTLRVRVVRSFWRNLRG